MFSVDNYTATCMARLPKYIVIIYMCSVNQRLHDSIYFFHCVSDLIKTFSNYLSSNRKAA